MSATNQLAIPDAPPTSLAPASDGVVCELFADEANLALAAVKKTHYEPVVPTVAHEQNLARSSAQTMGREPNVAQVTGSSAQTAIYDPNVARSSHEAPTIGHDNNMTTTVQFGSAAAAAATSTFADNLMDWHDSIGDLLMLSSLSPIAPENQDVKPNAFDDHFDQLIADGNDPDIVRLMREQFQQDHSKP